MSNTLNNRAVVTLTVAVVVAGVCVRLGVWQTSRLSQRRTHNATLLSRLSAPIVSTGTLGADTAAGHFRRTSVSGVFLHDRELAWGPRMNDGSPGVHLLTPMRTSDGDLVVVDRGWVYSPDARTVDFTRWREGDSSSVTGYLETWSQPCAGPAAGCADSGARALRRLDQATVERLVGARVAPFLLMQTSDSAYKPDSVPVRATIPILDEGPHRGYAFQWFGFAIVSLVGGVALARRERSG